MSEKTTADAVEKVRREETNSALETIHAAKDVIIFVTLVGAAVFLSANEHEQLAATAIGGALSYAIPSSSRVRVPPLALGLMLGSVAGFFT